VRKYVSILMVLGWVALFASCATTTHSWDSPSNSPGANESVLRFSNTIGMGRVSITINDQSRIINAGTSEIIVLPNGSYLIEARALDGNEFGLGRRNARLYINVNSEYILFQLTNPYRLGNLNFTIENRLSIENRRGFYIGTEIAGIENALNHAVGTLIDTMPQGGTIAILNMHSVDPSLAEFAMIELEYRLFRSQRFIIVDRHRLEQIRSEQHLHLSGEVDDASAVSIGHLLGASIVITGDVGSDVLGGRLAFRALDVRTAQLLTMALGRF